MNDKFNNIFFFAFFVAGLFGLYYGYSKFVEPYVLEAPSDTIGAPTPQWAKEPVKWKEPSFSKIPSTYKFPKRKSGILDLDFE